MSLIFILEYFQFTSKIYFIAIRTTTVIINQPLLEFCWIPTYNPSISKKIKTFRVDTHQHKEKFLAFSHNMTGRNLKKIILRYMQWPSTLLAIKGTRISGNALFQKMSIPSNERFFQFEHPTCPDRCLEVPIQCQILILIPKAGLHTMISWSDLSAIKHQSVNRTCV